MSRFLKVLLVFVAMVLYDPTIAESQTVLPMDASQWFVFYKSSTINPSLQPDGGLQFDFPPTTWCGVPGSPGSDCGETVNAIQWYAPKGGVAFCPSGQDCSRQHLVATFKIATTPSDPAVPISFDWQTEIGNTCSGPNCRAKATLYVQNNTVSGPQALTHRWYSCSNQYPLQDTNGVATLSAPLDPHLWCDVNGELGTSSSKTLKGWKDTFSAVTNSAVCLGGGFYDCHFVSVSKGSATLTLESFGTQ